MEPIIHAKICDFGVFGLSAVGIYRPAIDAAMPARRRWT